MPKKTVKRKVSKKVIADTSMSSRKSINITKADNGFVVSSYTDNGEKTLIAKTKKEAKKHADKLLGL